MKKKLKNEKKIYIFIIANSEKNWRATSAERQAHTHTHTTQDAYRSKRITKKKWTVFKKMIYTVFSGAGKTCTMIGDEVIGPGWLLFLF